MEAHRVTRNVFCTFLFYPHIYVFRKQLPQISQITTVSRFDSERLLTNYSELGKHWHPAITISQVRNVLPCLRALYWRPSMMSSFTWSNNNLWQSVAFSCVQEQLREREAGTDRERHGTRGSPTSPHSSPTLSFGRVSLSESLSSSAWPQVILYKTLNVHYIIVMILICRYSGRPNSTPQL
jgi:hypothetical protein